MKQLILKLLGAAFIALCITGNIAAQQKEKLGDNDEVIIKKKSDKDTKVIVEIKDGQVFVNGKAVEDFDDDNVSVRKRRITVRDGRSLALRGVAASPFRSSTWNFDNDNWAMAGNSNKAMLGVSTEKDEEGVKIMGISESSAAEKAGLKKGDIITKINDDVIENPAALSTTIGKYKPEEKVKVTFKRNNKTNTATATLLKREEMEIAIAPPHSFDVFENGDMNFDAFDMYTKPRLGIKAQDTEEGKGVKVLEVDDESAAAKAGVKEGDIITSFNGNNVNSADELMDAAKDVKNKSNFKINILRDGKTQEVEVKIPKKLKTASL
jgi:serine protease Do